MDAKPPIKKARSRKTLNADNLEALGAARLAAILVEVAGGQPTTKRRLRMELAAQVGADDLVLELDKALDALGGARTRVHWRRLKALRQDLELLRGMIAGRLAQADPAAAIRLLLRFIGMERGVLARLSDSKGEIGQVFADALGDLARLAATAGLPAFGAIEVIFEALDNARLGAMGDIVQALVPALDAEAIAGLRARIETGDGAAAADQRRLARCAAGADGRPGRRRSLCGDLFRGGGAAGVGRRPHRQAVLEGRPHRRGRAGAGGV